MLRSEGKPGAFPCPDVGPIEQFNEESLPCLGNAEGVFVC